MSPERRSICWSGWSEASAVERLPEAETELLLGCPVRLLSVAVNNPHAAKMAVLAELALPPFG